jgi:hypothetical protein
MEYWSIGNLFVAEDDIETISQYSIIPIFE